MPTAGRLYSGRRQPHKSRRGRVLRQAGAARWSSGTPGPGAYANVSTQSRIRSPRSPRAAFGRSRRFAKQTQFDLSGLAPPGGGIVLRPALGEQVVSTRASSGCCVFGRGSRAAAAISATRTGRRGVDSPGPIYHPQDDSRDLEKRLGIRPIYSPRERMLSLNASQSTISGRGGPAASLSTVSERPSTVSGAGSRRSRTRAPPENPKVISETRADLGYERPGTSFGRSRRPPLYTADKGNVPGPRYKTGSEPLSTIATAAKVHFGTSSRDQRKLIRGVVDDDQKGTAGPGPGAYFPQGEKSVALAERNTASGFGPAFTMRVRTGMGSMFAKADAMLAESQRLARAGIKPAGSVDLPSACGRQIEGPRKTRPRVLLTVAPRFGPMAGFTPGKR